MALARKTEWKFKAHMPKIALMTYIVLSALFILWTLFSMLKVWVYQVGYTDGANTTVYSIAAESLSQDACQYGITLPTADGQTTVLINSQCLSAPVDGGTEEVAQ